MVSAGPSSSRVEPVASVAGAPAALRSRLTLLKEFDLRIHGVRLSVPMSTQRVVAFLALRDRAVLRSHVAASLWLDATDAHAQASLRSALWRLGHEGGGIVMATNRSLQLNRSIDIDLRDSVTIAESALSRSSSWKPTDSDIASLSSDVLPDWYEDWVLVERERFRQLRMHALEAMCARLTARHSFGAAVQAGLAAVRAEPLRESAHRVLICVHIAEGNMGEALREYEDFRALLAEELDLDPSPAIKNLVRGIHR